MELTSEEQGLVVAHLTRATRVARAIAGGWRGVQMDDAEAEAHLAVCEGVRAMRGRPEIMDVGAWLMECVRNRVRNYIREECVVSTRYPTGFDLDKFIEAADPTKPLLDQLRQELLGLMRKDRKFTQQELADWLGVSLAVLRERILKGRKR